jgi:hypothetical protein
MINIPRGEEYYNLFTNHRLHVSACNIFFNTCKMISTRKTKFTRDMYKQYFEGELCEIELSSSPIEAFVICGETEDEDSLWTVNRLTPEYEKIKLVVTMEHFLEVVPMDNESAMAVKEDPINMDRVWDDIFVHFSVLKYLAQIEVIRLKMYSNAAPMIEYVVNNVSLKNFKNDYLHSNRLDDEKYAKHGKEIIFNPDIARCQKFYAVPHGDIPAFDVINLMNRLTKNLVMKSDIYIILAVYMILVFAMSDVFIQKDVESPCADYVKNVLSKL